MLVTGGIDGCHMFKFKTHTKYDPKQAVQLDPEGHFFMAYLSPRIKIDRTPLWIKGLKVNVADNMIFLWSQMKVNFNTLDGKLLFRYKKVISQDKSSNTYENHITDIFVSKKYSYFISSTYNGKIVVNKLSKRRELMHVFNSHSKCVTSLREIPDQPSLFISASNDNTIRIFSLDKFSELYSFILPAGVANISLLSAKRFACFYKSQINIGILHHLALSFYTSNIKVRQIVKVYKNETARQMNRAE